MRATMERENVVLVNAGSSGAVSFPGTWYSICYGAGMFVAVANSSADAAISSDGLSWTRCTLPEFGCWNAVCCGDGIFVAVQTGKICAYSSDGMTWYSRNMPQDADWTAAAYGNGRFFAVSSGGTVCAKSQDGAVWTADTMPMAANWSAVCYGGEGFAAVADSTQKMAVVTESGGLSDGTLTVTAESNTLYETMTMPASGYWDDVCYGNGKYVAVLRNSTGAYSADGKTWTNSGLDASYHWQRICFGDGKFVAIEAGSSGIKSALLRTGSTGHITICRKRRHGRTFATETENSSPSVFTNAPFPRTEKLGRWAVRRPPVCWHFPCATEAENLRRLPGATAFLRRTVSAGRRRCLASK